MRRYSRATAALLSGLALLGAAACGGSPEVSAPDSASSPSPKPETELSIEIEAADGAGEGSPSPAAPASWTLTCSPAGGDHPDPEAACADLEEAGAEGFEEVPKDSVCTHIMGGPEVATVTGHVGGSDIDTEFTKAGGCEMDRYESMGSVLTP
ncbi:SSI family serine proteinase inhibitor [Nocardiopsis coralliicola]